MELRRKVKNLMGKKICEFEIPPLLDEVIVMDNNMNVIGKLNLKEPVDESKFIENPDGSFTPKDGLKVVFKIK